MLLHLVVVSVAPSNLYRKNDRLNDAASVRYCNTFYRYKICCNQNIKWV